MSILNEKHNCYTLHFEPPDIPSIVNFLKNECYAKDLLKIFSISNVEERYVLCIDIDLVPRFEEAFPLLLEKGVSYNVFTDVITNITFDKLLEKLLKLLEE